MAVRRTVVRLLFDLAPTPPGWSHAAEVAADRLTDEDEHVRRAAAWLLVSAGGLARAAAVLTDESHPADPADPVARTALAEAALSRFVTGTEEARRELAERLRDDRDPAVRLVTSLARTRPGSR